MVTEITWTFSHLWFPGEDTMTGDGGEYLRAEDLRELGDDSLPGHYLDFSYMNNMNMDRYKNNPTLSSRLQSSSSYQYTVQYLSSWWGTLHTGTNTDIRVNIRVALLQVTTHSSSPKLPSEGGILHRRHAHKPPGEELLISLSSFCLMNPFCKYGFLETDPASLQRKFPFLLCFFLQVSVLSKEHEKDSFRLSWGAEHLDNVVLSSSLLHSGYTNAHTHSHTRRSHPVLYVQLLLSTAKSSLNQFTWFPFHCYLLLSSMWCCSVFSAVSP